LESACNRFREAAELSPDRAEASKALRETEDALRTQRSLAGMTVQPEISLRFKRGPEDLFQHGLQFAVLMTASPPPVGPANAPIHWSFRLQGREPLSPSNLTGRIRLCQKGTGKCFGESVTPLRAGRQMHFLEGEANAPADGWPAGDYEIRMETSTGQKTRAMGEPTTFQVGRVDWTEKKLHVTAPAVRSGGFRLPTGVSFHAGDALTIDAAGELSPGPDSFVAGLRPESLRGRKTSAGPQGIAVDPSNQGLTRYWLVANHLPFAALLYQLEPRRWLPYVQGQPPLVAEADGEIVLSINSVMGERRGDDFQAIAAGDQRFWRPDGGSFDVTVRRAVFTLPADAPKSLKLYLLKCFSPSNQ
jgi:hypothetical protein